MQTAVETITPEKAQQYLKTSKGNRPISKATVRSYADSMRQGKWMLNGVPIVFDYDSALQDGHHRLHAIVDSGIPVQMLVVRGVSPSAFTTFDCGLHRTLGQLLALQSKKNYNTVGSVVVASETIRMYGKLWQNNNVTNKPSEKRTNTDNYEVYMKDPSGYDDAAEFACTMYQNAPKILKQSWIGSIYYHLTTIGGYCKKDVEKFFMGLCSLSESDIPSVEVLRQRLIKENLCGVKSDAKVKFALIVKAWNAYVTNNHKKCLSFNPEKDNYPSFILRTK